VYDKNTEGSYSFTGEFVLIDGITNPEGYKAERLYVLTDAVVKVSYEDEDGNKLTTDVTLNGPVSTNYTTENKAFTGYTLTQMPTNASGKFTLNDIDVQYIYKEDSVVTPDRKITTPYYNSIHLKTGWYEITDLPLPSKAEVRLDDGSKVE